MSATPLQALSTICTMSGCGVRILYIGDTAPAFCTKHAEQIAGAQSAAHGVRITDEQLPCMATDCHDAPRPGSIFCAAHADSAFGAGRTAPAIQKQACDEARAALDNIQATETLANLRAAALPLECRVIDAGQRLCIAAAIGIALAKADALDLRDGLHKAMEAIL